MTPDQLLSSLHRQRTDLTAMRLALSDLAQLLPADVRAQWLTALQTRIATTRQAAPNLPPDQRDALQATAVSLEYLHKSLAELGQPAGKTDA